MKRTWIAGLGVILVMAGLAAVAIVAVSGTGRAKEFAVNSASQEKPLYHCGMHPQVIQPHPGTCPICHMPLTPLASGRGDKSKPATEHKILYWWDPMLGPASITDHPGKSAMGMDMVPVYSDQVSRGPEISIDPRVVQEMGVQTAPVTRGPLHQTVRAVGLLMTPEPGLHDISLKVGGWIDKLYADQDGMHVQTGQPLFALYSQDLQVAEQELIAAAKSRRSLPAGGSEALKKEAESLTASARRKLELWDIDPREIDAIANAEQAPKDVTFYSPASGHLQDKSVVQGSAVQPGMKLMRIADHTTMWLNIDVYEEQIQLIQLGQMVQVSVDAVPDTIFSGKISFIYPHLDHMTRTLTVRAIFDNPDFKLKPGMYADARVLTEPLPDVMQVPQEAVIDTGTKQIVFVTSGDGHFAPRAVRSGMRGDGDRIQIIEGLSLGENVVTSGQFLMDVESHTQEAIAKLRGGSEVPAPNAPGSRPALPTDSMQQMKPDMNRPARLQPQAAK